MSDWAPWLTLVSPLLTAASLAIGGIYGYGQFKERGIQFEKRILEKIDTSVRVLEASHNVCHDEMTQRLNRLEGPYFRSPAVGAAPLENK